MLVYYSLLPSVHTILSSQLCEIRNSKITHSVHRVFQTINAIEITKDDLYNSHVLRVTPNGNQSNYFNVRMYAFTRERQKSSSSK